MPTYNPNDFYPRTGQEIKTDGTTVNEADGINPDGSQNVQLTGRKTSYQRVFVNQNIVANGNINIVIPTGLGTRATQVLFNANANIQVQAIPVDNSGNLLTNTAAIASSATAAQGSLIINELGGAPYLGLLVWDKSGVANNIHFFDVWWTQA